MAVRYLESLETTGSQYINTGFKPNNNTRLVIEISGLPITEESQLFGTRSSSSASDRFMFIVAGSPQGYRTDFYNNNVSFASSVNYSGRLKVDKNKNVTTLNDTDSVTNTSGTFSSSNPLYILASNTGGNAGGAVSVTFYSCQIYDNGTLVRDYRPAIDTSGVVCMYDEVNKEYVYNAGSGSFVAGAEIIVPDVQLGTLCRLPKKIGTSGGGSGDKLVIYEAGKAEIQNGTVTIGSYNDYASYSVGSDKLTVTMASNATLLVGQLYIDDIDLTEYTKIVATGYAGANVVALLGYTINSTDTTSSDFTKGSLTTVSLDISTLTGEQQLYVYFEGVKNQAFELYLTEIYLEKGESSGGGTTPSEYAVTLAGDLSSSRAYVEIVDTAEQYTYAQTVAVATGTQLKIYCSGKTPTAFGSIVITLNGTTVAQGSRGNPATYILEVTSTTTITFTEVSNGTYYTAAITTE